MSKCDRASAPSARCSSSRRDETSARDLPDDVSGWASDGSHGHRDCLKDRRHGFSRYRCRPDPPRTDGALDRGRLGAADAAAGRRADDLQRDGLLSGAARLAVGPLLVLPAAGGSAVLPDAHLSRRRRAVPRKCANDVSLDVFARTQGGLLRMKSAASVLAALMCAAAIAAAASKPDVKFPLVNLG